MIIGLPKFLAVSWTVALSGCLLDDSLAVEDYFIHLASLFTFDEQRPCRVRRQTSIDACVNAKTVSWIPLYKVDEPTAIKFNTRYAETVRPWTSSAYPNVQLHTSANLLYNWELMKSTRIRGMGMDLSKVLFLYDKNNCPFIAWGRAVRNLVMSEQETLPIVGETDCTVARIYRICKSLFSKKVCHVIDNGAAILVGDLRGNRSVPGESLLEPLRLYTWQTFWTPHAIQREFTVNALGLYDNYAGQVSLIDLTGAGFADACHRQIRSAGVNPTEWHDWTRLLKYIEASLFGLIAPNNELENFVRDEIRRHYRKEDFQAFLCESVYEGVHLADTSTCAASAERVAELKAERMTRMRAVVDSMFTRYGEAADEFYSNIMNAMTTIKFAADLPIVQPPIDKTMDKPTPTAPTEPIYFIHSHRSRPMPTAFSVARDGTRSSLARPADNLSPPRVPYLTTRPPFYYPRPLPSVVIRFADGQGADEKFDSDELITDWPLSEELDDAASRAIDSDETVRSRLGAPVGHPIRRRPFGIIMFSMTTPFDQFPMRTHPTDTNPKPIRL